MSNHQDPDVAAALASDLIIDITTIGRTSGARKRLEIWYHIVDGRYYITGRPGPRSWYANVLVNPAITFHVKQSAKADLPATATAVTDPAAKRAVFLNAPKLKEFITEDSVQEWVDGSPLIESGSCPGSRPSSVCGSRSTIPSPPDRGEMPKAEGGRHDSWRLAMDF